MVSWRMLICLTSPDRIYRAIQSRSGLDSSPWDVLERVFPSERRAPIVAVLDGHPHTLSFLGRIWDTPSTCLGVTEFGQSGDLDDLYAHHEIDTEAIIGSALDLA